MRPDNAQDETKACTHLVLLCHMLAELSAATGNDQYAAGLRFIALFAQYAVAVCQDGR